MTHDTHIPSSTDRLRHLAARGRLMLCGLLAWLAEMFGASPIGRAMRDMLRADLLAFRRGLAGILILLALPRLAHMGCPSNTHPANAPRGFRRAIRKDSLRFAQRMLPWAGDLRGRIAVLMAVLDDLDGWIERMAAHIARDDDIVAALVVVCGLSESCASLTCAAQAHEDSS